MEIQSTTLSMNKMACVQFIAEVSLIANCKPSELKIALSIIAEIAHSELKTADQGDFFYEVE